MDQRFALLTVTLLLAAGCLAPAQPSDIAVASYPVAFLVQELAGDDLTVVRLGPPGGAVHDYEPSIGDINLLRQADLLILHGLGLEPWADRALQSLSRAPDVLHVGRPAMGEDLLESDHDHAHHDHGDGMVGALDVFDAGAGAELLELHGDHWHGHLDLEEGHALRLEGRFLDSHGHTLPVGEHEAYQFTGRLAPGAPTGIVSFASEGDHLVLTGTAHGETRIVFQLWHDDHADWESPPVRVYVGDREHHDDHGHDDHDHGDHGHGDHGDHGHSDHDDHDHGDHGHGDHGDHGHGDHDDHGHGDHGHGDHGHDDHGYGPDPHTWMDPLAHLTSARIIANALQERHPQHAEAIGTRLADLEARLLALHEEYEAGLAHCARSTIATNHNAYAYQARRYGFEVVSLYDVEPGMQPSPRDLQSVLQTIEQHQLPVFFIEEGTDPSVARAITERTNARVDHLHTLETSPAQGDYFTEMRANLQKLQTALGCASA